MEPTPAAGALSPREAEVLGLTARGVPPAAVAAALGLSPNTVKTHLGRAAVKLGAASRAAALREAAARGLVAPPRPPAGGALVADVLRLAAARGLLPPGRRWRTA